jgi:hypothetical protein
MIKDFCETSTNMKHRTLELARRLKAYYTAPDDPEGGCKRAVEWYCDQTGEPFLETWSDINGMWPEVKYIEDGNDGFEWAAPLAIEFPVDLTGFALPPREPQHVYLQAASLAVHLHHFNGGKDFLLPVDKVAKWLGYRAHTQFSRWILPWLKENESNILTCTDHSFQFGAKGKRCKKYQLTAQFLSFLYPEHNKMQDDALSSEKQR